jgi:hypothetical protein
MGVFVNSHCTELEKDEEYMKTKLAEKRKAQ